MSKANNYTIRDIQEGLRKKEFSVEEIFSHYQKKIKKDNKKLNSYLSVFDKRNTNLQMQMHPNATNILSGVPCAVKDNILIDGTVCTAGSKILKNYISAYDATVIKKLRSAGAQFLGKTNMDEFAVGACTEVSAFGPVKNPLDTSRIPGGSSGGAAAAVAADLAVFALGSDTGGSVRQPAAMCGIVGLKPTYGRVSRHGLIAMASSFDQIGPLTKTVEDAALVLNTICGYDHFDSTTSKKSVPNFAENLSKDIKGLKVGIPKEFFTAPSATLDEESSERRGEGLSAEVSEKVRAAISKMENIGCKIEEITLPNFEYALAAYYILVPSEASSNLARFDGIRYGYSSKNAETLLDTYLESRSDGFGPEPKRRIMIGAYALSAGYYDAYYTKAQKVRALIKKDFDEAFKKVDLIAGPTTPTTAFKIGEKSDDPLALYLEDIYTVPVNLAGLPGISIPCGFGKDSGLPIGFQMMGKPFDEETLLRVAHQLEQNL